MKDLKFENTFEQALETINGRTKREACLCLEVE